MRQELVKQFAGQLVAITAVRVNDNTRQLTMTQEQAEEWVRLIAHIAQSVDQ